MHLSPAEVNISYIVTYLLHRPPTVPMRTFLDEWFAYCNGEPFLNRNGKPRWFNNPNPATDRDALEKMHFISEGARSVLNGELSADLIKEHVVPVKVLQQLLIEIDDPTFDKVRNVLLASYRVGVLTKDEDQKLRNLKLTSKMPAGWDGSNVWARYEAAEINGKKQSL